MTCIQLALPQVETCNFKKWSVNYYMNKEKFYGNT